MKANPDSMIAIPIEKLRAGDPAPFPLYVFLRRNERMVPVRLEGDLLDPEMLRSFREKHHEELWIPKSYQKTFEQYLAYLERSDPAAIFQEQAVDSERVLAETAALVARADQPGLCLMASNLAANLFAVEGDGEEAREASATSTRAFSDAVLASMPGPFYESVRAMRSIQSSTHHSLIVGSVAGLLAAAAGHSTRLVADLIAAGTFHDIGLALLPRATPDSGAEYEDHVLASVKLLESSPDPIPETVIQLIREHHERQDRPGFPSATPAAMLREGSELLIMANLFDDLCNGKETGTRQSPRAAFSWLLDRDPAGARGRAALESIGER
jgi:HD-GYP domain-containing protein (c-di-GMP phosphodiesterase class II)